MSQEKDTAQKNATQAFLRQEFKAIRDAYHQKCAQFRAQISTHQKIIEENEYKIGKLEAQLRSEKPRLDDASRECPACDIISMVYDHMVPGQGMREHLYKCRICGYEAYNT